MRPGIDRNIHGRRETHDVVPPENRLELAEIGFRQIGARVYRAIIDAANFQRQRIGLRRYQ